MADLLDDHPLRGRKRHEARIWAAAARTWAAKVYHRDGALYECLERARQELAQRRVYRGFVAAGAVPTIRNPDALYGFFAGFFSGEGYLLLDPNRKRAQVIVKLRRDDLPLLRCFQQEFGIGGIIQGERSDSHPTALWHVSARRDLLTAVEILDTAPLLGRKARQYQAWRPAALELGHAASAGRQPDVGVIAGARERLSDVSRYRPGLHQLPRDDAAGDARRAHIETLRSWAERHEGRLSCLAYADAREAGRGWPTRNTITNAFGSWRNALVAAGLADRAPRPAGR